MKIVYTPEGADPRSWDFDPMKLMSAECMAIEKLTRLTYVEALNQLSRGSMTAIHAVLYVLMKRTLPTLTPSEVQFSLDEIDLVQEDDDEPESAEGGDPKED